MRDQTDRTDTGKVSSKLTESNQSLFE